MSNQRLAGVKLSADSLKMLDWLDAGNTAEICTSAGRCLGELVLSEKAPVHSPLTTLNTLLQYPLLVQEEVLVLGLRWLRLSYRHKAGSGQ